MTALGGPPPGYAGPPPGYAGPPPGYAGPPPAPARMSPAVIVAVFVGVLLGLTLVAGVIVLLNTPPPPIPQCQPGEPCSGPPISVASPAPSGAPTAQPTGIPTSQPSAAPSTAAPSTPAPSTDAPSTSAPSTSAPSTSAPTATPSSDSPPAVSGAVWSDADLAYSFEYNENLYQLSNSQPGMAVLRGTRFDAQIVVIGRHGATSPAQLIAEQLGLVDRFLIGRVADDDPYDALLGPSIGYVRGEGGVFSGTLTSQDGTPVAPGGITILAATDGRLTVAVLIIVGTPDLLLADDLTHQKAVRSTTDLILKTFDWDTR